MFSTPFMVAVLCGPMLGEWVGWRRWTRDRRRLLSACCWWRGRASAACIRRRLLSLGGAVCYAFYVDLDARAVAHRLQRDDAVLFQSGRRGGHDCRSCRSSGRRRRAGFIVGADGADRRARQRRALSADRRPPPGAGLGAGAVHLYADGLDDDARLSGVRRRAAPLDDRRAA